MRLSFVPGPNNFANHGPAPQGAAEKLNAFNTCRPVPRRTNLREGTGFV
jgi:hypothetical protein